MRCFVALSMSLSLLALASCSASNYRQAPGPYDLGYFTHEMKPGEWWVVFTARAPADRESVEAAARRRATDVCGGAYEYLPAFPYDLEFAALCGDCWDIEAAQIWVKCKP
jgi:hypothetical protein